MAHKEQQDFCDRVKERFPFFFFDKRVLDVGSLDINGNNRRLFSACDYTGLDLAPGPNVDIVSPVHLLQVKKPFDTIISTEVLEHDMHWKESLKNICRLLALPGLFVFTCASLRRKEHGTVRKSAASSPFTTQRPEWQSYYRNLVIEDFDTAFLSTFLRYEFTYARNKQDLYFWGFR